MVAFTEREKRKRKFKSMCVDSASINELDGNWLKSGDDYEDVSKIAYRLELSKLIEFDDFLQETYWISMSMGDKSFSYDRLFNHFKDDIEFQRQIRSSSQGFQRDRRTVRWKK